MVCPQFVFFGDRGDPDNLVLAGQSTRDKKKRPLGAVMHPKPKAHSVSGQLLREDTPCLRPKLTCAWRANCCPACAKRDAIPTRSLKSSGLMLSTNVQSRSGTGLFSTSATWKPSIGTCYAADYCPPPTPIRRSTGCLLSASIRLAEVFRLTSLPTGPRSTRSANTFRGHVTSWTKDSRRLAMAPARTTASSLPRCC